MASVSLRPTLTGILVLSSCTINHPIMVLPNQLRTSGEVMSVSGKSGGLLWNPQVRFGRYTTLNIHRGWRSDSFSNWHALEVRESWDASLPVSFVLLGPMQEQWSVKCLGTAFRRHREKPIGFGWSNSDGLGIEREVVKDVSTELFECDFQGGVPSRHWKILLSDVDPAGFGGVVLDDRGKILGRVQATDKQIGEPYEYTVPSPLGFLLATEEGWHIAVERAFQGKVVLDRRIPSNLACPWAAVATALLVWERLR